MAIGSVNGEHHFHMMVSKHYYKNSKGQVRYRKKPFDFTLTSVVKSDRPLLVYAVIRNPLTEMCHAECWFSDEPFLPILEFFHRAWCPAEYKLLWGLPERLHVSQSLLRKFWVEFQIVVFAGVRVMDFSCAEYGHATSGIVNIEHDTWRQIRKHGDEHLTPRGFQYMMPFVSQGNNWGGHYGWLFPRKVLVPDEDITRWASYGSVSEYDREKWRNECREAYKRDPFEKNNYADYLDRLESDSAFVRMIENH